MVVRFLVIGKEDYVLRMTEKPFLLYKYIFIPVRSSIDHRHFSTQSTRANKRLMI